MDRRTRSLAIVTSLLLTLASPSALACQAHLSAFDSVGEIRLSEGPQPRPLFFAFNYSTSANDRPMPLSRPELLRGRINDFRQGAITRIELVRATSWRRDVLVSLSSKASSFGFWWFDLGQWNTDAVQYDFRVLRTLAGDPRKSFTLSRVEIPQTAARRPENYWFVPPPTAADDISRRQETLDACERAAVSAHSVCNRNASMRDAESALVYRPRRVDCVTFYGFRGKPAMFYWRGDDLAGVANVSPEAYRALTLSNR